MEECDSILDVEQGDKSIYGENVDAVHSNANKNDTEFTQDIS